MGTAGACGWRVGAGLLDWDWDWDRDSGHIRFCGYGCLRFRPYGGLLGRTERRPAPSNQAPAPLTYGGSPRLAMPSLRSCSMGPPPLAIPAGLPTAQNLRSAFRRGRSRSKAKARRPDSRPEVRQDHRGEHQCHAPPKSPVGASLLAMDAQTPRLLRPHALSLTSIASRLAPTGGTRTLEERGDAEPWRGTVRQGRRRLVSWRSALPGHPP
ncbi:hypothetical protein PS704_00713 [Pseudomonas fluorescens]|uniref:Uncharacterized protein n=1 Tax=Pseudomonas fluorescens TaxID=294 RepID=A0A5E7A8L9_PSEFL|nr:hypothetical protein PS704_00713 [Pseudomonas fluorescens]